LPRPPCIMSSTPGPRASGTRSSSTSMPPCWRTPRRRGQSVLEDGAHVPAGTSQRLACDASRVVMRHDPEGRVVEVGARTGTDTFGTVPIRGVVTRRRAA
jgi:hypothetical protein